MNRGLRPGQRATAQEIAEQTAKYAENLKLISDLTGEDAKAKAEKVRDENAELAFEAQKAKMSKDQRAQLDVAMAGMTELERKNLRERMVFGTVINRAGAIQESIVEGQREKGLRYAELLKQNNLTTQTVTDVNSQYAKRIKDSTLANADTIGKAGMALGGDLASLAKNQADSLRQSNQYNAENVAETKKNLEKTKQGVGSEGIVNAQQAAQDFANKLEALATDNLDSFGTALTTTIKDITKAVEYLKDESILGRLSKIDWTLVAMSALPAMLATAVPAIIAMVGKSGIGAAAGGAGGAVKSALGGMAKGGIAAIGGVGLSMAGNAVGGKTGAGMDVAGQALSYGGTGAMLGTAFGPLGTLIGAGVGATIGAGMGLYQNYGTLTGTTDDYSGLSIKGAESTAGGRASSALVEKARRLQEMFPGGYFSAFNDAYHNRYKPNSEHASGKAFDFVLPFSVKGDEKKAQEVLAQIKSLGFSQVLDEYNHPSAGATGQHIHAQLDSGGYVPTGSTALVGERGPEVIQGPATVTSRVQTDNMASKISELAELFKQIVGQNTEMLNILKDHKDISRKLLSATA
jgi:hypothetical protein